MNWFKIFKLSNSTKGHCSSIGESSRHKAVRTATDLAWKRYNKTFNDLARYDRGEKISDSILRIK